MSTTNRSVSTLLIALVALTAPAFAESQNEELEMFKQAIRAKYDIKENAFRNHDPLPIMNQFYTEDVISVGPDGVIKGRKALLEEYKKHIADTVRIESVHTYVNGNAGWDWANFYVTPADISVKPFVFTILFLWEKRNGEWWSPGDMYNLGEMRP